MFPTRIYIVMSSLLILPISNVYNFVNKFRDETEFSSHDSFVFNCEARRLDPFFLAHFPKATVPGSKAAFERALEQRTVGTAVRALSVLVVCRPGA